MTRNHGRTRAVLLATVVLLSVVLGVVPLSETGKAAVTSFAIASEDTEIAPGNSFDYFGFHETSSDYLYVVIDEDGNGAYTAGEQYMNISVGTPSFDRTFPGGKTAGLDRTYQVYAIDGTTFADRTLDAGDDLTNGTSAQISIDASPPWVSDVNLTNPSGQTLEFSFTTNEQLNWTSVSLTGEESATFVKSDFTETSDNGTHTYTTSYGVSNDGDYTAEITLANDTVGNDAGDNQSAAELSDTVTVDTVPPGLQGVETAVGSDTAVLTFNESVVDDSGTALSAGDFQFDDGNGGGATGISSVNHTAGTNTATVTFDAAVSATDLGNDTIVAKTGSVYDGYGNAAGTTAKSLRDTVGPDAPTGASASAINASNQGSYDVSVTLPDDHEAGTLRLSLDGGAITTSTEVANGTDPDSSGDVVTFGGIDATGLSEGSVSIDATFTDYGGNSNGASGLASVPKDTGRPTVTDASITNAPIGTYDAGTAQTVTVEFNESVDGSVAPTVEVTNLNRTYAVSGSFDDTTTWTGTVTIVDDNEQRTATIAVSDAADTVGNVMTADGSNAFQVDTTGPAKPDSTDAANVTLSNRNDYDVTVNLVADSEADEVSVKVTDRTTTVVENRSITPGTETVNVTGLDVSSLDDGSITVSALALDSGYPNTEGYTAPTTATKDTKRPNVSSITVGDGEINDVDAGTGQPVTVTFDEDMNRSVSPTVKLADLNRTYAVNGSFDSDTAWTGTVTIADDDETTTGNVTVTGAADALGNALVTANRSVSVDTETPSITGLDVAHTGGGTVSVSFNASESLDSASVSLGTPSGTTTLSSFTESESGPYEYTATYSGGDDGSYTATLDAANDAAGNDGATGQSDTVTVDTTPPSFGNPTPDATTVTDDGTVLSVDIADTTGSVDGASIRVPFASTTVTRIDAVGTGHGGVSYGGGTLTVDPSAAGITLADGDVNVTVSANDTAGNVNATDFSFVVDTAPPTFENAGPTGTVTDNLTAIHVDIADATTDVDAGSVLVTLRNTSGQLFSGGTGTDGVSLSGGTLTIDPAGTGVPTLPNGTVTVNVSASDTVGNGEATDFEFDVDVPPFVSEFEATKGSSMDVDVSFDSTDELDTVAVTVSGAENATLTTGDFAVTPDGDGGYTYTATYTGGTDGNYTFELDTADDGRTDGATGDAETVLVDETAPAVSISAPDGGTTVRGGETTSIEWTATDSVSVDTVSIAYSTDGGGSWTAVDSDTPNDGSEDWTVLAVDSASVLVRVRATDTSGNVATDASNATFVIDSTAPTVDDYSVSNPDGQDVAVSFDTDERLQTIAVAISGSESGTLTISDFAETDHGNGTYTYAVTYAGSSDGNYTATLNTAVDDAGNDGSTGQFESVSIDTATPTISNFDLRNPDGRNLTVAFDSDERLGSFTVAVSGAESFNSTSADFSRNGTTYTATYGVGSDGNYTATLVDASDEAGNDATTGQTDSLGIDTTPPTVSNFVATNPSDRRMVVSFDSSEPLSAVHVSIFSAENATLTLADFTANGTTYTATHNGSTDGTYIATLDQALDNESSDGASGEVASVTVDTSQSSGGSGDGNSGSGGSGGSSGGDGDSGSDGSGGTSDDSPDTDTSPEPELSVTVTPGANETTAVTVENADANQQVGVGFDNGTGSSGVNLSRLNLTVERPMNYDLTVNASTGRLGEASDFAGHAVGFVEIDHSVGDSDIDGACLTFDIDSRRFEDVGMDATDAVVYRYHGGHWNALPTSVIGQTDDSYVVRADSPGLSVFAVGLRDADLLSVTGASLSEPSAAVGTPVTVSATVTNRGNWLANESLAVTANGTVLTERIVTVPAGETVTVTFDVTRSGPGTYGIAVDDTSAGTVAFSETDGTPTTTRTTTRTPTATTTATSTMTPTVQATETSETTPVGRPREKSDGPDWWLFVGGITLLGSVAVLAWRVR